MGVLGEREGDGDEDCVSGMLGRTKQSCIGGLGGEPTIFFLLVLLSLPLPRHRIY